jgi:hypothetical protein
MTLVRHLTEHQVLAALRRGATVEQMLSRDLRAGSFRWMVARATEGGFVLRSHETRDDGSEDFLDVHEFRPVDADAPEEGVVVGRFTDAASLLEAAAALGARPDRWVNEGLVQDEYGDLRARR